MCGITGFISLHGELSHSKDYLSSALLKLKKRGPNAPSFPKAALASVLADSQPSFSSSSFQQSLIPFPPPPAVAFNFEIILLIYSLF